MVQLAIKGHATRGSEVIEILEMLGGKIRHDRLAGNEVFCWYYINGNGYIDYIHYSQSHDTTVFSLEKFLEKFPYKVGDKVQHKGATSCGSVFKVEKMKWVGDHVEYTVKRLWYYNGYSTVTAEDLQPYEETMEERKYADLRLDVDQDDKLATEATIDGDKITPPKNYLIGKITKVDNGMIVEFVKKQPQYPKTYAGCCDALNLPFIGDIIPDGNWTYGREYLDKHLDALRNFHKLRICRDAYWKIAGEQMGLGKPWGPDWMESDERKYCIGIIRGNMTRWEQQTTSKFLAFPTAEMRDAFYENFKELIEQCKELL